MHPIDIPIYRRYTLTEISLTRRVFFMKYGILSAQGEAFLDRTLSGSVFNWHQIMDLLIPGVLDSLSIMFCNTLITALISSNGESSVAAVSLVGPISWLTICVFNGISAGGTVIVAQSTGKDDTALLRKAAGMTLWLTIGIGVVVSLPLLLFPDGILHALYPEGEALVLEKAQTYLSGCIWSILVFTVYTAIFAILRGLGESRRCLILSIIINVGYLLFSILFLNILKLDIQGSVLALFLARLVGTVAAVVALFVWNPPLRCRLRELFVYDGSLVKSCMKISIPLGLEQICISLGNLVSGMYMITLGTTAVATHAIANSLISLLYSPAMSAGSLAVTVVGRCVGAGKTDEAYRYGKICNRIALLLLVLFGILFYPLLPVLLRQYNPTPQATQVATSLLYWSIPALLLFWPAANILPSTLRAASDSLYPSILSLATLWAINIALGYALAIPAGLGLWGVWAALWISWTIRWIGFRHRFRSRKWLKASLQKAA